MVHIVLAHHSLPLHLSVLHVLLHHACLVELHAVHRRLTHWASLVHVLVLQTLHHLEVVELPINQNLVKMRCKLTVIADSTPRTSSAGSCATGAVSTATSSFGLVSILGCQQFANYLDSIIEGCSGRASIHSLEKQSPRVRNRQIKAGQRRPRTAIILLSMIATAIPPARSQSSSRDSWGIGSLEFSHHITESLSLQFWGCWCQVQCIF